MSAKSGTGDGDGGEIRRHAKPMSGPDGDEVYRSLVDHLPTAVCRKDLGGAVVFANRRFCEWLGRPRDEVLGRVDAELFPAELAALLGEGDRHAVCNGAGAGEEMIDLAPWRAQRVLVRRIAIRDARGVVIGLHVVLDEVAGGDGFHLNALLENSPDSIYFKDREGRFTRVSRSLAPKFGLSAPEQALGKTDFDFFTREHADQAMRDEQEIMRTGQSLVDVEEKETFADGSIRWVSSTKMPLRDAAGAVIGTFGVSRDITERKRMEEQLARQAFYDVLTQLPNRALFGNRLEHLFRRARRGGERVVFAVLYVDIDRFKGVNDSFGHLAGDELITQVARRLEACLRPSDTLARLGGDDFAILLEDLRQAGDAIRVAERIQQHLTGPFAVQGTEVFCSASIGIALSTSGYDRAEEMLRDADTAMYRAKANGRGRHEVFDADMHRRAVSQLRLETDLRRAVERQELVVYYQPIVDLAERRLTGFEALVRWNHPQRGLVGPAEFIPVAEETGLIAPIGLWVLDEACRQMRHWRARYPSQSPLRVSVNISGHQLTRPDLVDDIRRTLETHEVDPQALTVEITESALVRDMAAGAAVMQKLRQLSIQLNIDDFGTGYSSLSYLQNLPVDALKIDRSFVSRMRGAGEKSEIVQAIISLAHNLGMKVVAEGVETRDQLEALLSLHCNGAQGFLFARPLPAADADRLLAAGLPAF